MHSQRNTKPSRAKVWTLVSIVFFVIGFAALGWMARFYWHYKTGGAHLLTQYSKAVRSSDKAHSVVDRPQGGRVGCGPKNSQPVEFGGIFGVLDIPSLGVRAPVENGDSTSVLSDAVGHDPASSWPGVTGTSVLFAHDVTWFSGIAKLHQGEIISFSDSCWSYNYSVMAHKVVHQGTELVTLEHPSIYLVTCWPENALYFTPERYVLTAQLVSITPTTKPSPSATQNGSVENLTAFGTTPADTLAENPTPMGYLHLVGSPSVSFQQSPQALKDISLVIEEFFYRERQAKLPPITTVDHGLNVSLNVHGNQLIGAQASDVVTLATGQEVQLTVNEQVAGRALTSTPLVEQKA